jgi:ankyrin repeat/BTB/POZ domain-containing protein 1
MGEEYDDYDYLGEDNELPEPFEWLNLIPKPPIGEETVFTACARGDLAALRGLVELNGESIDDQDSFNAVPLYYACLCGHYKVVDYLLCRGARCQVDTFDTTRCLYAALTDDIRRLLKHFQAANRQRGPLLAFTFRVFNLVGYGFPDVSFIIESPSSSSSPTIIQAHRAILSARCEYFLLKFQGKWKDREKIKLVDPRMSAQALVATLGYLYTERLLVAPSLLLNVATIARNLKLYSLATFAEQEAARESQKSTARRVIVNDFGKDYFVGSFPISDSLRCDFYNNLVHNGIIPAAAFTDVRAAGDDVDEDGETIIIGEEWKDNNESTLPPFYDTEILVRKRALFRCHKAFLCGRSRYFESLLAFVNESNTDGINTTTSTNSTTSTTTNDTSTSASLITTRPLINRFELMDVSPFVFGVILEYLYSDVVRPMPTVALALEALNAADAYLLLDGMKPLLASRTASHLRLDTFCDIYRAASLFNALKLSESAARFAALEIDAVAALPEFAELINTDAAAVKGRQEYDSVPIVDDIRTEIRLYLPGKAQIEEKNRRFKILDDLCDALGLKLRKTRSD